MDWLDILTIGCGVAALILLVGGTAYASYLTRFKPLIDDLDRHLKDHP
jgi:hypothetical protein